MSPKRIENRFHNSLENYASIVDDDQLWSEIEDRVPKKEKKRRFFIWFAFGLPILALGLIGFLWVSDNTNDRTIQNVRYTQDSNEADRSLLLSNEKDILSNPESSEAEDSISADGKTKVELDKKSSRKSFYNTQNGKEPILKNPNKKDEIKQQIIQQKYANIQNSRKEVNVSDIYRIPLNSNVNSLYPGQTLEIPTKAKKKRRLVKPLRVTKSFIGLNYYAGNLSSKKSTIGQDADNLNFGEDYFSQGLSLSYGRFISSKLYGRLILSIDQSYKKYEAITSRDTIVPSSNGNQIISFTQYSNGVIDIKSGIPNVKGTYNREVLNLNELTTASVGIGLGFEQALGRCKVNLEADVQRSFYFNISGLGNTDSDQKIHDLKTYENYFSSQPKYIINAQLNLDYQISNSIILSGGVQHQFGMSSIFNSEIGHSEKVNLIRGSLGVKLKIEN